MAVSEQVKAIIRAQAQNRCGYCRSLQMYVLGILEIDHIIPKAVGGTDNEENLWLACSLCNRVHLIFANIFVGAKHFGSKSLILTNKLSAEMLRPCKIEMHPCNNYKGIQTDALDPVTQTRVTLFNPRTQQWSEHFAWSEEGTEIRGVTDCGRATVTALQLNNNIAVTVRRQWVSAGWHPPIE